MAEENDLSKAAAKLAEVKAQFEEPHLAIAEAMSNYGFELVGAGQRQQGLQKLLQARDMIKACQESEDRTILLVVTLNLLSNVHFMQDESQQGLEYMQQGLVLSKELSGERQGVHALQLRALAEAHLRLGNLEQAAEHIEKSMSLIERLGQMHLSPPVLLTLARVQASSQRLPEALETCERVLPHFPRGVRDSEEMATLSGALDLLVDAAMAVSDLARVNKYLHAASSAFCQLHGLQHPKSAWYVSMEARLYLDQGDLVRALYMAKAGVRLSLSLHAQAPAVEVYTALDLLGDAYQAAGKFRKAIVHYQNALALLKHLRGDGASDEAAGTLNSLATAFQGAGELMQATKHFEQSSEMLSRLHGNAPHPQRVQNLTTSGSIYSELGECERAVTCFQQAWAMGQQLPGRTPTSDALMLQNLGSAYIAVGAVDTALEHLRQAQALLEQSDGDGDGDQQPNNGSNAHRQSPHRASLTLALANAYDELFQYEQAVALCQQGLDAMMALYHPSAAAGEAAHPEISQALMLMAAIVAKTGDLAKSKSFYEEALACDRRLYGAGVPHSQVVSKLLNMTSIHEIMGDVPASFDALHEAAALVRSMPDDQARLPLLCAVAQAHASMLNTAGRFTESRREVEAVLDRTPSDAVRMDLVAELATSSYGLGNFEQAIEGFTEVLVFHKELSGDKPNSKQPMVWEALAECYLDLNDLAKAADYLDRSVEMIAECISDRRHPFHFQVQCSRAEVFALRGRLDDARTCIAAAEYACEQLVGASSYFPANIARQQGIVYKAQHDWPNAIQAFDKVLQLIKPLFPNSLNPVCRKTLVDIGDCYFEVGELAKAEASWQLVADLFRKQNPSHALLPSIQSRLSKLSNPASSSQPVASSSSDQH